MFSFVDKTGFSFISGIVSPRVKEWQAGMGRVWSTGDKWLSKGELGIEKCCYWVSLETRDKWVLDNSTSFTEIMNS